jgi:hypothetical protein
VKFLKADGTVEDGTPMTDEQEKLRSALEEYIHSVVCRGSYHGTYDKRRCQDAANFLYSAVSVNDAEDRGVAEAINSQLESMKPKPVPVPEPAPVVLMDVAGEEDPL